MVPLHETTFNWSITTKWTLGTSHSPRFETCHLFQGHPTHPDPHPSGCLISVYVIAKTSSGRGESPEGRAFNEGWGTSSQNTEVSWVPPPFRHRRNYSRTLSGPPPDTEPQWTLSHRLPSPVGSYRRPVHVAPSSSTTSFQKWWNLLARRDDHNLRPTIRQKPNGRTTSVPLSRNDIPWMFHVRVTPRVEPPNSHSRRPRRDLELRRGSSMGARPATMNPQQFVPFSGPHGLEVTVSSLIFSPKICFIGCNTFQSTQKGVYGYFGCSVRQTRLETQVCESDGHEGRVSVSRRRRGEPRRLGGRVRQVTTTGVVNPTPKILCLKRHRKFFYVLPF